MSDWIHPPSSTIVSATSNDQILECPRCLEHFLSHNRVEVVVRDAEDQDGSLITVNGNARTDQGDVLMRMDKVASEECIGRRDHLVIHFSCEHCGIVKLQVVQHKGQTLLRWETDA